MSPTNQPLTSTKQGTDYSGFSLSYNAYISLLTTLASHAHALTTTVHSRPLLVGQRNAPDLAYDLYETLDFGVVDGCLGLPEDVGLFDDQWAFSFCDIFADAYVGTGKPVFQIEFPDSVAEVGEKLNQTDYDFYCGKGGVGITGFSEVLKQWETAYGGSEGWVQYCGAGLEGEVYSTPTVLW